ncbi:hypothetical protein QZJ86_08910 [Methylomonas montana]|uniref:hypothetical protein n=1 Tax=Methylomonas montana TaxID=3058963 RepID=UPI00265B47DD|nr:hypothetical protein [Methylomonas montana]WKJ92243.1 hypothetical protein QZJ86_08910 [Methylomonas montana]
MNPFSEYPQYDALGLAHLLQTGEVSAGESLDAIIAKAVQQTPFTPITNITRQPAISVPL